ncbi:hypothetical protein [Helicobacter sp. 23-1045]
MLYQKFKKNLKKTLQTIIPNKMPDFSVCEVENPLFFAYFVNGDIFHISHSENIAFSEVIIDEVVKVGFENDEFIFYPQNAESAYFKGDFELDTYRFVELILENNLSEIASAIHAKIAQFREKIVDSAMLYKLKMQNAICNVEFVGEVFDEDLKWEIESAIKSLICEIASENIIDSKRHIFEVLFENGIYDFDNIAESAPVRDIFKRYYNRSNLSDNIQRSLEIKLNKMRFFISYFFENIFLSTNIKGKIFIDSKVFINDIFLIGAPEINYANADLKIAFSGENIEITNLQKIQVILHSIKSNLKAQNAESTFDSNNEIIINDKIIVKNTALLAIQNKAKDSKIAHKLELIYSVGGVEKRFVGSGSVKNIL